MALTLSNKIQFLSIRAGCISSESRFGASNIFSLGPPDGGRTSPRPNCKEALRELLPLIYNELRRLAHRYIQGQRPGHTLQSTALVHEAYLRLVRPGGKFQNGEHFFAICAQLMRQILVEYARSQQAAKRNKGRKVTFDDAVALVKGRSLDLVALDDALSTAWPNSIHGNAAWWNCVSSALDSRSLFSAHNTSARLWTGLPTRAYLAARKNHAVSRVITFASPQMRS